MVMVGRITTQISPIPHRRMKMLPMFIQGRVGQARYAWTEPTRQEVH
jgi:hypothetical protein